jgi:hypothetical protein
MCTLSIGISGCYLARLRWGWLRLAIVGGIVNALAFMVGGVLISQLLSNDVLQNIHERADIAKVILASTTGMTGFVLGAILLAIFPRSVRSTQLTEVLLKAEKGQFDEQSSESALRLGGEPRGALKELGGYSRASIEELEGRYICFRPMFSNPNIINAYEVTIRWDEKRASLLFEEYSRSDSSHTQIGQVYIPDGKPFMSLVTADKGAVRVIMVARPDHLGVARGLLLTLSNPGGIHFIPATAPVVLQRLSGGSPQVGFVHPEAPDYKMYFAQLNSIAPDFAIFATVGQLWNVNPSLPTTRESKTNVQLSVVDSAKA